VSRYLRRPGANGRQPTDPIVRLANKRIGRAVISNFLKWFYQTQSYQGRAYWNETRPGFTIGGRFPNAESDFVSGRKTSLPTCRR
jgi:hypothetical protein